jgi:hypothetical protein
MRIVICTPVHGETKAKFSQCLFRLGVRTALCPFSVSGGPPVTLEVDSFIRSASNVGYCRRLLAQEALAAAADYILWIDADQTFPPNALIRLLASQKAIIGANIRRRNPDEVVPTAFDLIGKPLQPKREGVEEVLQLGLGLCLVHTSVLKAIEPPYFAEEVQRNGMDVLGEDVYFFRKARAAGFAAFIDHGLSLEVGHIAETELRFPSPSS